MKLQNKLLVIVLFSLFFSFWNNVQAGEVSKKMVLSEKSNQGEPVKIKNKKAHGFFNKILKKRKSFLFNKAPIKNTNISENLVLWIPLLLILTTISLFILKLTGVILIAWFWVFMPLIILLSSIVLVLFSLILLLMVIAATYEEEENGCY